MTYAIYSRKSKFTGTGDSVENQVQICKDYVERLDDMNINYKIYEDEGFSGKSTNRPMFQLMMKDVYAGKIDTIICYRLDRVSRRVADFSSWLETLQDHQVNFISVREAFDTSSPMGRAMIYIASVFAQLERETIAERVRDNKIEIAKGGRWQGGKPPFGFKAVKETSVDPSGKSRSYFYLEIDEDSEALLYAKEVFRIFEEKGSLHGLQKTLLMNHKLTPSGTEPKMSVLRQTLSNPVYASNDQAVYDYFVEKGCTIAESKDAFDGTKGLMGYGKSETGSQSKRARANLDNWIIAFGKHKPIISGERWVSIMKLLEKNKDRAPRMDTSKIALFSGLVKCSCGSPMVVKNNRINKDGSSAFYYRCVRKDSSRGELCQAKNINGKRFDQQMVEKIRNILSQNGVIGDRVKNSIDLLKLKQTDIQKQSFILEDKIHSNEEQMRTLVMKLVDPNLTSSLQEQINKVVTEISEQTEQLKNDLLKARKRKDDINNDHLNIDLIKYKIVDFMNNFDSAEHDRKVEMIKSVVKEIVCEKDDYHVYLHIDKLTPD